MSAPATPEPTIRMSLSSLNGRSSNVGRRGCPAFRSAVVAGAGWWIDSSRPPHQRSLVVSNLRQSSRRENTGVPGLEQPLLDGSAAICVGFKIGQACACDAKADSKVHEVASRVRRKIGNAGCGARPAKEPGMQFVCWSVLGARSPVPKGDYYRRGHAKLKRCSARYGMHLRSCPINSMCNGIYSKMN